MKIVYDAESSYKIENLETIGRAGLDAAGRVIPRTVTEGIRHNKFVVLLRITGPIGVWTGSTNISAGGIFGHSNVGHMVWDRGVAAEYLDYWTPAVEEPDADEAAAIEPRRDADTGGEAPEEQRDGALQRARRGRRDHDAEVVRGPDGRSEGDRLHHRGVQSGRGVSEGAFRRKTTSSGTS